MKYPTPRYDQYNLPEYVVRGLKRYYEEGQLPEGFIYAIISNNLFNVVSYSDQASFEVVKQTCLCIFNEFMPGTFGSPEAMKTHMINVQRSLRESEIQGLTTG